MANRVELSKEMCSVFGFPEKEAHKINMFAPTIRHMERILNTVSDLKTQIKETKNGQGKVLK